ncbi:hypothetical protein P3X46_022293 [Hevea brasiliensis]|uniref:Pentacotripeptide-repeat region of PRORP domain-containing protein n=1 Tax=Hevea brasiliensis TaxID=3981 RepID=A0ABQ9L7G9_HEVBR|nr:hypothetical protein P3X46_022293 [Hevea brasiliensis]
MKQYHTVISLSRTIESLGISHNIYSLSILINCFCRLHLVNFGFSILGKIIKFGLEPNTVTFTTLIKGLCIDGKINGAVDFFNDMVAGGYQPNTRTYNVIVNALCKCGKKKYEAYKVFRGMKKSGCLPNDCCYNVIIQGFLKHKDVSKATQLINEMVDKGFSAHATAFELVIHLSPNEDLIVRKLRNRSKFSKGANFK